jgi:hypothetical protein
LTAISAKPAKWENLPCLGEWAAVGAEVLSNVGLDEVVVALELEQTALLPQIIAAPKRNGTKISIIPYYNDYIPSSTTIQTLGIANCLASYYAARLSGKRSSSGCLISCLLWF